MNEINVPIDRDDGDDECISNYLRVKLTENEKLINGFFRSLVLSDKRFMVPGKGTTKVFVLKVEDISIEWTTFRKAWEEANGVVKGE